MADISKIILPSGDEYNLRDRSIHVIELAYQSTNSDGMSQYMSSVDINTIYNYLQNSEIVILKSNSTYWYYIDNDRRTPLTMVFENHYSSLSPIYNTTNTNLWQAEIHDFTIPETMANVKTMLTKYGLDTTTVYTENTADTATAGGSVLTQ